MGFVGIKSKIMSKDPAFLFYPGDWLGGTMTFNRSHKGAYMDVLMAQFNCGHLTIEDIKTVLTHDFELMWESKLKRKFIQDSEGRYFNEKLEKELVARKNFTESRRKNLIKKERTDKKHPPHMEPHIDDHMEDGDRNEDVISIEFDVFWNSYDKKVGKKEKLENKWVGLSAKDRELIMNYIPKYKQSQPDKKYRKNPETFLNNKSWLDEIIQISKPESKSLEYKNKHINDIWKV